MPSPGSLFDSSELARWRSSSRPHARQASLQVTVVCGCGVLMEVTWARARAVHCFGCGRAFPPPPGVRPDVVWKPELARDPLALAPEASAGDPGSGTRVLVRRALVSALVGLVCLWLIQTGARLWCGPAEDPRTSELPLKTAPGSDDR